MAKEATLERDDLAYARKGNRGFRILVVDDDDTILRVISRYLKDIGYSVETTVSGARSVEMVHEENYDLVILDLKLPDRNGLEVLKELKEANSGISVMMMTGYGKVETAVEAMKLGADDYLLKPFKSFDVLDISIKRIKEYRDLKAECRFLKEQLNVIDNIVGKSKSLADIFQLIKKVAPLTSTVLIEGESGTGKELIARAIHQNSLRSQQRFVAINCGAIPLNLLESELFGYERGAFTGAVHEKRGLFEAANNGTLFLDEISEMDQSLQVKLLRVIQEKRFQRIGGTEEKATDVRIVTSTNRNLNEEVLHGRFRKDLYYRINVIKIHIPPLRDRPEDIPLLSHFFLQKYSKEFNKSQKGISPKVMSTILHYRWDGNVRELENVIEHAVAMAESDEISISDLPEYLVSATTANGLNTPLKPFDDAKRQFEKQYVERALEKCHGNIAEAARLTSIPRQNIYDKIKKYGVNPNQFR
jgi:DNA-binding NtrC family response regulator